MTEVQKAFEKLADEAVELINECDYKILDMLTKFHTKNCKTQSRDCLEDFLEQASIEIVAKTETMRALEEINKKRAN